LTNNIINVVLNLIRLGLVHGADVAD
jgi:hypothetical protein